MRINETLTAGTLASLPKHRVTPRGTHVLDFTVSGTLYPEERRPERKVPFYVPCTLMGKSAEYLAPLLIQGTPLLVSGSLQHETWVTGQKSGQRVKVKVRDASVLKAPFAFQLDSGGGSRAINGMNSVNVGGNIVRVHAERITPSGEKCTDVDIAVDEADDKTHYFKVSCWRHLSEKAQTLQKGDSVLFTGFLTGEHWVTDEGEKRSLLKIEAQSLQAVCRKLAEVAIITKNLPAPTS